MPKMDFLNPQEAENINKQKWKQAGAELCQAQSSLS